MGSNTDFFVKSYSQRIFADFVSKIAIIYFNTYDF